MSVTEPITAACGNPPISWFGEDWFVYRPVAGMIPQVEQTLRLTRALRGALLRYAPRDAGHVLSGHGVDGGPSEATHVAFLCLPELEGRARRVIGSVRGLALVPPRGVVPSERAVLSRSLSAWHLVEGSRPRLTLGRDGVLQLRPTPVEPGAPTRVSADWVGPARVWRSVTPVVLDRFPGDLEAAKPSARRRAVERAHQSVLLACERIGLPRPSVVRLGDEAGVPARRFPAFRASRDRPPSFHLHVELEFSSAVRGPVILGAGRFYGYGLLLPEVSMGDDGWPGRRARDRYAIMASGSE